MSLDPLLSEGFVVASHAFAAIAALLLGAVQLAAPKGTLPHRALGYAWAVLMLYIAIGSFWISELQLWGRWSPIHILSVLVIVTVPLAVWRAHRHQVRDHKRGMIALYALALVVTGLFTLWPGRVMHAVLFGS
ncbi:hypothetical protein DRV85_07745 [Rhodosalinus halophilus]|uniref:DUF2306 domain-containing protein n=1 Tax=Rhodosalinus halophilus TaxID=2259333 RepID=A0A365UBE2_9RHOB|nr:DUF2306 domain-containing protein [Rhodosalinus halophilus]RBI85617.1 hypothetical protein DRV85_07745 [Rhodosalinus halophilus]